MTASHCAGGCVLSSGETPRPARPLTLGAPGYPSTAASTARAGSAATVPAGERAVYDAWMAWSQRQRFNGGKTLRDFAKPALLNRLDWYAAHGWRVAYPGDPKIYSPDQVPGRNLPTEALEGLCRRRSGA